MEQEVTRGIASNMTYSLIGRNIENRAQVEYRRARTITRTEAGRIQEQANYDAAEKAKEAGADVVKQWSAIRDGKTRDTHRAADGQIREIDEPFVVGGHKGMKPHGFGVAAEDINCRCTMLTRARAALDEDELERMQKRAEFFGLDKSEDFRKKYLKAAQTVEKQRVLEYNGSGKTDNSQAPITQSYVDALNAGGKASTLGNVDCVVVEEDSMDLMTAKVA